MSKRMKSSVINVPPGQIGTREEILANIEKQKRIFDKFYRIITTGLWPAESEGDDSHR